ncbi:L-2-amino-thiazoline-4-carboxylic acid hydrolase, partial [Mycolicibacterium palauense]|uniref:L-2-amino-thiazoline-4-carboxylic acid hydrolase n=1 Tax=Mycolicibacterium palauense TaxID=2034511 RepID=UPI000BFEBB81
MAEHRPRRDVSELPHYGQHFPFLPWTTTTKLRVSWVFARRLRAELGWTRFIAFWLRLPVAALPALRTCRAGFSLMHDSFGFLAEMEWILLVVIHRRLEASSGKERAYRFAREAIQDCSRFMMNEFYQADRLARFDDPFEAFWSYHTAMFADDPNYPNELIDEGDLKVMVVHQCRNCQIAALTVPELAPLGCDHDITGYRAIGDKTRMEFRRPVTLAKDGQPCRFMFYRQGWPSLARVTGVPTSIPGLSSHVFSRY